MNTPIRHVGTIGPIVALGGILLATAVDPTFSWTADALSDLGVRDESARIFNGSLVLGGVCGSVYAAGLWSTATTALERSVSVSFGLSCVSLAGVGIFVIGHPLHLPAAIAFYGLFTLTLVIDGLNRRKQRAGQHVLALVVIHVVIWLSWGLGLWPGSGLALPEYIAALLVPVWVWAIGPVPTLLSLSLTDLADN